MKQRITCVIALLIALYGAAGYLIVFQVSREALRSEMQAAIERNDPEKTITDFSFSKSSWKSIQTGRGEFMLDGKVYDIVSYEEDGDHINVSAVCDSKENELLQLFSQVQHPSDDSGSLPEDLIDFLNSLMINDNSENNTFFTSVPAISTSIIFPASSSYYLLIYSPPDFMMKG